MAVLGAVVEITVLEAQEIHRLLLHRRAIMVVRGIPMEQLMVWLVAVAAQVRLVNH